MDDDADRARLHDSPISFGLVPAASTRDGDSISSGMCPRSVGPHATGGTPTPIRLFFMPMSVTDDLLRNNEAYAARFDYGDLPLPPAKKLAVVACMDSRLDVHGLLGLRLGDAHVIRNAGGVVTDDEIRSLAISQRLLRTEEIVLIHHTDCGMLTFTDDSFRADIQSDTGIKPPWSPESFTDLDADVRSSIGRITASPFIPNKGSVRGFVYDVLTGKLREVTPA
jgi:carbonic anhydrase